MKKIILFLLVLALLLFLPLACSRPMKHNPNLNLISEAKNTLQSKGLVILVHGLNNKPEVMEELARYFNTLGYDSKLFSLRGHSVESNGEVLEPSAKEWSSDLREVLKELKPKYLDKPILGVGFSTGGVVLLNSVITDEIKFNKLILFAPAFSLNSYTKLTKLVTPFSFLRFPSFMPKDYAAHDFPSISLYSAMFDSILNLEENLVKRDKTNDVPNGIIFISKDDEFINLAGTKKFIQDNSLNIKAVEVNPEPKFKGSFKHLIIDQDSLGDNEWKKVQEEIKILLNL